MEAGFRKRVPLGADQMNWPAVMKVRIEATPTAECLTHERKRDILTGNTARFHRLSKIEISSRHSHTQE